VSLGNIQNFEILLIYIIDLEESN